MVEGYKSRISTHFFSPAPDKGDYPGKYNFYLITDTKDLEVVFEQQASVLALDTETTSLNHLEAQLVGYSFCSDGVNAYYVPVGHLVGNINDPQRAVSLLREFLKGKSVLFYNKRYDLRILEQQNIDTTTFKHLDVMGPVWLCDTNFPMPSLKFAEKHFLGWNPISFEDLTQGAALVAMNPAKVTQYAATDALGTYLLFDRTVMLLSESRYIIHLDNAATDVIKKIEETPIRLDIEYLERLLPQVDKDLERLRVEIFKLAGTVFNPDSSDQVGQVLVANGCAPNSYTATGKVATSAKVLKHVKHPLVQKLLEYRSKATVRGSYIIKLIEEARRKEGKIFVNHLTCRVPCLGEETILYCRKRGFIQICEAKKGDEIWTMGGWDRVDEVKQTTRSRVFNCELTDGRILRGSYRHPVMTIRGEKGLGYLRKGDILDPDGRYRTREHLERYKPVPIGFVLQAGKLKEKELVLAQPRNVDLELIYLWGYLAAAGRLNGKSLAVICTQRTRFQLVEAVLKFHRAPVFSVVRHKEEYQVEFQSSVLVAFYQHCKVMCDCLPPLVAESGPCAVLWFVRGLLEYSEAMVEGILEEDLEIHSSKKTMLRQIQVCLACLEFDTELIRTGKGYKLRFMTQSGKRYLSRYPLRSGKICRQEEPECIRYFPMVKRVWSGTRKERLWDIAMEREPWFLSGGVYTHNTGRYSTGADAKNSFFSRVNIQSIPNAKSQDYVARPSPTPGQDRGKWICGYIFEPVDLKHCPPGTEYVEGKTDFDNVRKGIVSWDGYLWVSIDFKAQELRIPANFSGEPVFLKAFQQGLDLHTEVAKAVFGSGSREFRRIAKNLNFGLMYLGSARTIQREIGCSYEQAQDYVRKYEAAHRTLYRWKKIVIAKAKRLGFVKTFYGRPSRVRAALSSSDSREVFYGQAKSVNSIVQGCLPGHVRVLTDHGYLPVEYLYLLEGHKYKVWTGKRWAGFKVVHKGKAHPAYLFTKDGRRLDCDHRHIVRRHTGAGSSRFDECTDLKSGQALCTVSPAPVRFVERDMNRSCYTNGGAYRFSKDQLEQLAYWVGIFLVHARRRGNTLIVELDRQDRLEELRQLLESVGLLVRVVAQSHLSVTSRSFFHYLTGVWQCDFSYLIRRRVPKILWTLPLRYRERFLMGALGANSLAADQWQVPGVTMARELQMLYEITFDQALRLRHVAGQAVLFLDNKSRPRHQDQAYNRAYYHDYRIDKDSDLIETYTLCVEDEDPQFVSEGIISKNTGADVLKKAMVNVHLNRGELLEKKDLVFHPAVHDEINFLIREEKAPMIIPLLIQDMTIMEEGWTVPLTVDLSIGRSWGMIFPFKLTGDGHLAPEVKTKS